VSNKHKPFCGRLRHRQTGRPNRAAETLSTARPAPRTPAPAGPTGPRALSPPLPTLNSQKKNRIQYFGEIRIYIFKNNFDWEIEVPWQIQPWRPSVMERSNRAWNQVPLTKMISPSWGWSLRHVCLVESIAGLQYFCKILVFPALSIKGSLLKYSASPNIM
jgi:hypothetical protein